MLLPVDNEAGDYFSNDALRITVHSTEIPDGWKGLDIGPVTQQLFADEIHKARTVIWNGPMGVSEFPNFAARHRGCCQGYGRDRRCVHHRRRRLCGGC